jgi:hypothetical protein
MSKFNEIESLVASLKEDASKFWEQDNNAAGTRLRKGMQQLKELAQVEREML